MQAGYIDRRQAHWLNQIEDRYEQQGMYISTSTSQTLTHTCPAVVIHTAFRPRSPKWAVNLIPEVYNQRLRDTNSQEEENPVAPPRDSNVTVETQRPEI